MNPLILAVIGTAGLLYVLRRLQVRLRLSRAKHPSLTGHAKISRFLARQIPFYEYRGDEALACDGAADEVIRRRKQGLDRLSGRLAARSPESVRRTSELAPAVSDMQFTGANRVPFQFRTLAREYLKTPSLAAETSGVRIRDLDGHWSYDLGGSYGVNLLGYDFYKACIRRGVETAEALGPLLGPYHPVVADNVDKVRSISGLDEVSFHMSGTEAVMQAVRLARYHTGRTQLVMSTGAYHGWWDGVQPGVGHQRRAKDIFMLADQSDATLRVLETRRDIACVLVNPLQALHPNASASSDAMLIDSKRAAAFDKEAYGAWLKRLRQVCDERSIVLVFDEVFLGFRLGLGGAQEYFGVRADMVTYGKTIGGGLPVGVLAGKASLMKRYRDDRPADVCFARGTFNSHPYVMATMNEFLKHACGPEFREAAEDAESVWNSRAVRLNDRLVERNLPIRVRNMVSVWTVVYTQPGRFNWLLQYYLRSEGLSLSWVGTGRFIFSHNYTEDDFNEVADRILTAATTMLEDGWWDVPAGLTNASIRKRVFREILKTRLRLA